MGFKTFQYIGVVGVLAVLSSACFFTNARATNGYAWSGVETIVESEMKFPRDTPNSTCRYTEKYVDLYPGMLDKRFCAQTGDTMTFGTYFNRGSALYYYGAQNDQLYPFTSSMCYRYDDCLYIPEKDMLIALENRITSGTVRSLVVYKNFTSRTIFHNSPSDQVSKSVYYSFNSDNPDYIFEDPDTHYAWPVVSINSSSNGEWLAAAFYNRGIGLMNLSTLQMKRVSMTPEYQYGYGYDPYPELAVSNTGMNITAVGMNAGFTMIDIDGVCGDDALVAWAHGTAPLARKCKISYPEFGKFTDHFVEAYKPKYYDDGGRLSFTVLSYDNTSKGVILRHPGIEARAVSYIAMGDSYSSGEGETDDGHYLEGTNLPLEKCHVSDRSYPFVFMNLIGLSAGATRNIACSGAKTIDAAADPKVFYTGQKNLAGILKLEPRAYAPLKFDALTSFIPGRGLQEDFIATHKPRFTTIGIGGNDVGLMDIMKACIMPGTCEFAQPGPMRYGVAKQIRALYPALVRLYSKTLADSPGVKLAVIGYPDPFGVGDQCSLTLSTMLTSEEREFFRTTITYLNQIMQDAARKVGVQYVDTWTAYGEHSLCGSSSDKAIRHIVFGDDIGLFKNSRWFNVFGKESFHPTPLGHQLLAGVMARQIPSLTYSACSSGYYTCPVDSALASSIDAYWTEGLSASEVPPDLRGVDATVTSADIGSTVDITVPPDTFTPGSMINVELHSEPASLGSWNAGLDGSLHASFVIPDTTPAGIHVLHMLGTSGDGNSIDAYSVLAVNEQPKPEPVAETVVLEPQTEKVTVTVGQERTTADQELHDITPVTSAISGLPVVTFKPGVLSMQPRAEEKGTTLTWIYYTTAGSVLILIVLVVIFRKKRFS